MKAHLVSAGLVLGTLLASQSAFAALPPPKPLELALGAYASVNLDPALETALDSHLADIVAWNEGDPSQVSTGAVILVARHGKVVYLNSQGLRDGNTALGGDPAELMPIDAIFDLESMTKPFTAAVILRMDDLGLLDIDDLVIDHLPEFELVVDPNDPPVLISDPAKATVTIRDMLRFMSGLSVDAATSVYGVSDPYLAMSHEVPIAPPGALVLYSDLAYRLLGHLAEKAYAAANPTSAARTLRELVQLYVTTPLGMVDTGYEPLFTMAPAQNDRVAGTGYFAHYGLVPGVPGGYRRGEVQDDQDHWTQRNNSMFPAPPPPAPQSPTGTGCDGLFSTAMDLGQFAQMLLNRGRYVGSPTSCVGPCYVKSVLSLTSVQRLTTIQTLDGAGAPLGDPTPADWTSDLLFADKASGFELALGRDHSVGGHWLQGYSKTGGAGTFLVVDPQDDLFIVVLTNHGLPDFSSDPAFTQSFNEMLEEIGPHRISDSVAGAILDPVLW